MNNNIEIDGKFYKGDSHSICEDYILISDSDVPFAIVSDGCSSSKDSDVGARILSLAFKKMMSIVDLSTNPDWANFKDPKNIIFRELFSSIVKKFTVDFNLENSVLDATVLLLYLNKENKQFYVFGFGDGNVLIKKTNKDFLHYNYNYPSNFPFYLSYYLNDSSYSEIYKEYENFRLRFPETTSYLQKKETLYHNGVRLNTKLTNLFSPEGFYHTFPAEDIEWIMIASDGIETFQSITNEEKTDNKDFGVDNVTLEMAKVKSLKGEFIQRRINRMLKEFKKQGYSHSDDLSVAGIAINREDA